MCLIVWATRLGQVTCVGPFRAIYWALFGSTVRILKFDLQVFYKNVRLCKVVNLYVHI